MSMVGDRLNPAVAAQLKGKRVLVTNDDGIDADGLARLETLARRYCDDVWVIAPATHQSARSRGITLRTPLRVVELGEQRAAVGLDSEYIRTLYYDPVVALLEPDGGMRFVPCAAGPKDRRACAVMVNQALRLLQS